MGWDRKQRGNSKGYYYRSVRTATGVKKQYLGRSTQAHLAVFEIEDKRQTRQRVAQMIRDDQSATAEAERLAEELLAWTELLATAWYALTGHYYRAGEWRKRHGQGPKETTHQ